jgi:hypothetical protein
MSGVRGAAWASYSPGGKPPFLMITYGHLSSAIYIAHQEGGNNPQVRDSIAAGLKGATVFRESLPEDRISQIPHLEVNNGTPHTVGNPTILSHQEQPTYLVPLIFPRIRVLRHATRFPYQGPQLVHGIQGPEFWPRYPV